MRQSRYNVVVERGEHTWIHNGLSGCVYAVETEQWAGTLAFLEGGSADLPDLSALRDLTLARMLVQDDADELAVLEARYRAGTADRSSLALTIVTSLGCNFDCPYCFENKTPELLDEETERLLLELLDEQLPRLHRFHVTWYGGEPLLAPDRIDRLSRVFLGRTAAHGVAYSASVVTNGYLLTQEMAERLRGLRVGKAQVTLDGPPATHDLMRPLRNGRPTFEVILDNVVACAEILQITIRVNLDASNVAAAEELLDLLVDRGLAGRVTVRPGRIVAYDDGVGAPSETYRTPCLTLPEFAGVERGFLAAARARGLAPAELPGPVTSPCTAVRANELVVGARGELYKCYDSVGNPREVVGHLRSWADPDDRALKWLRYDPFSDDECRACIALPTCMGGCAHNQLTEPGDSRCSTYRLTHRRQVEEYVEAAEASDPLAVGAGPRRTLPLVAVT